MAREQVHIPTTQEVGTACESPYSNDTRGRDTIILRRQNGAEGVYIPTTQEVGTVRECPYSNDATGVGTPRSTEVGTARERP